MLQCDTHASVDLARLAVHSLTTGMARSETMLAPKVDSWLMACQRLVLFSRRA